MDEQETSIVHFGEEVEGLKKLKKLKKFKGFKGLKKFMSALTSFQLFFVNCCCYRCINLIIKPMYTFSFERLEVWNKSRLLTKKIYELTLNFPEDEKFGMTSQIRRAVISVCSNPVK
jgi:hypothetical protein